MLPVNETELTWPELARRYVLSLLSMDGGLLCGSLTGVAGMEADSMLLAEASKKIFGSLTRENDVIYVEDDDSDDLDATETNACKMVIFQSGHWYWNLFVTNDFGGPRNKASGVDFDFSEQKKKKTLQLVQATIVVEDMVKTEYLKKRMVVLVFSFSGC
ncbi:Uncharacterized protein Rs2_19427 [Raphanus sativus]|nr:Uncharacterized protein Rs2_19427 [Raphanus sativus]